MIQETPGRAIARARQLKGWTQAQLAAELGVHLNSVQKWEAGEHFPARNWAAVEELLGITIPGRESEAQAR